MVYCIASTGYWSWEGAYYCTAGKFGRKFNWGGIVTAILNFPNIFDDVIVIW